MVTRVPAPRRRSTTKPRAPVTRFFAAAIFALALGAPATLGAQTLEEYDYENLEFRGLGVHLGYVFPMKVESTLAAVTRNHRAAVDVSGRDARQVIELHKPVFLAFLQNDGPRN